MEFKNRLISVVMPIYDRTDILRQAIESVLDQRWNDFELLLVMDKSPEETKKVVMEYYHHPKVRIFETEENTGNACLPRNIGIHEANGDYILFLDSDDKMWPGRMEISFNELQENDLVYGNWMRFRENGVMETGKTSQATLDGMLKIGNHINQSTVGVRREALIKAGGLKRKMGYMEDYELWCRMMYLGFKIKHIHHTLAVYRFHDGNLEKKIGDAKWKQTLLEEYKKVPEKIELTSYKEINL